MWVRTVFTDTNITCAISSVVKSRARWPSTSCFLGREGLDDDRQVRPALPRARDAGPAADVVQPVVLLDQSRVGVQQPARGTGLAPAAERRPATGPGARLAAPRRRPGRHRALAAGRDRPADRRRTPHAQGARGARPRRPALPRPRRSRRFPFFFCGPTSARSCHKLGCNRRDAADGRVSWGCSKSRAAGPDSRGSGTPVPRVGTCDRGRSTRALRRSGGGQGRRAMDLVPAALDRPIAVSPMRPSMSSPISVCRTAPIPFRVEAESGGADGVETSSAGRPRPERGRWLSVER